MLAFILRRLVQSVAVLLVVGLVAFFLFRYVGDPINGMVGQDTPAVEREALKQKLGLNDPAPIQFLHFVGNAARGWFGLSYRTSEPVNRMILERLPATLELSFCAALFALLVGVPMGVYTGLYPRHWSSRALQAISLIGVSLPTFVIGILLILVFSVILHWLPSFGRGETVDLGWWTTNFLRWKGIEALIMPSITLGLFQLTLIMRLVRSEMLEVMRTDYIKFARARGLTNRAVNFGHALKNTLVPVITVTGLQLGSLIAFSVVTETVFAWPGVGQLFIQSVQFVDIPVMAAYLMLIGLLFVLINLAVDLLYFAVDPRLRGGGLARAGGH
ncbi:MAG: ABC transporter permease [Reyranella sp.]|uniref:ABC transporter permease n=1 Tax=Reyranella sp. TaxID=1929291 RepID=UPI001AC8E3D3|nr:ABC transporter permease [Reyranella sp.]MBN9087681.1 ABC transporter permease [Reyranella sp.]